MTQATRTEKDMLGSRVLPADALYGIHTLRAIENFPVSGMVLGDFPGFVTSLAMVKKACALANRDLGVLASERADAIAAACDRLIAGETMDQFLVDMLQGGAGTSTNMNANEVIANLALRAMGRQPGDYACLHPNDHVNLSQSTNDVYPSAIRVTVIRSATVLEAAQRRLCDALRAKGAEFAGIVKVARTQLQDAVPMTLGDEFSAFAETVEEDIAQLRHNVDLMRELNLGGTAIGTRINAPVGFSERAIAHLQSIAGVTLKGSRNLIEATSDTGAFVSLSGALKRIAVKLSKVCNDLRLLSSGPRAGLAEIRLPPMQAGSSIMPGKVNPVIPEMMNQISFQVIGNDMTVTLAAGAGQLQLNAMEPVITLNILQSMRLLSRGMDIFTTRCIEGIQADAARCAALLEGSLVLAAALNPSIGYAQAARVSGIALATGRSLRDVVRDEGLMTDADLERALDPARLASGTA